MGKGLIIILIVLIVVIAGGFFIYNTSSEVSEDDTREAVSNYLYENKIEECNSDSNDRYIYEDDCEDYYKCYSEEYSNNVDGTYINEIKNNLNEKGSSKLTYEGIKIIPEVENNDQYDVYDINNKCFIQIYEGKGLVSSSNARSYFEEVSKKALQQETSERDCLINAVKSRMSSFEVTALANFIKSDEEKYYLAGFEIFREIKVVEDADLRDFTEQCAQA